MSLAQMIIDLYPDSVAEFGLLGCGLATLAVAALFIPFIGGCVLVASLIREDSHHV